MVTGFFAAKTVAVKASEMNSAVRVTNAKFSYEHWRPAGEGGVQRSVALRLRPRSDAAQEAACAAAYRDDL